MGNGVRHGILSGANKPRLERKSTILEGTMDGCGTQVTVSIARWVTSRTEPPPRLLRTTFPAFPVPRDRSAPICPATARRAPKDRVGRHRAALWSRFRRRIKACHPYRARSGAVSDG